MSILRGFLDWCVAEKIIRANPVRELAVKVKVPQRVPRALSAEDAATLWAHLPDARARCIAALGLQVGLRRAEVAGLVIENIDWSKRQVRVLGKGAKERVVPLTDEAVEAMSAYLEETPASSGPLIRSKIEPAKGIEPPTLGKMMTGYFRRAGLKHHPWDGRSMHALRHTAATDVLEECGDITVVRDMLGHSDVKTTQVYLRGTPSDRLRAAMEGRRYGS
ncbi:MAG: tyrosine-type recombinase/integrase [Actinomycetota bacterium]